MFIKAINFLYTFWNHNVIYTHATQHCFWIWALGVRSLGWEDLREKGMATHSSNLAWRTPWTEEPGGTPWGHTGSGKTEQQKSMGSQSQTWLSNSHFYTHKSLFRNWGICSGFSALIQCACIKTHEHDSWGFNQIVFHVDFKLEFNECDHLIFLAGSRLDSTHQRRPWGEGRGAGNRRRESKKLSGSRDPFVLWYLRKKSWGDYWFTFSEYRLWSNISLWIERNILRNHLSVQQNMTAL